MVCKNCNREVEDNCLICPHCYYEVRYNNEKDKVTRFAENSGECLKEIFKTPLFLCLTICLSVISLIQVRNLFLDFSLDYGFFGIILIVIDLLLLGMTVLPTIAAWKLYLDKSRDITREIGFLELYMTQCVVAAVRNTVILSAASFFGSIAGYGAVVAGGASVVGGLIGCGIYAILASKVKKYYGTMKHFYLMREYYATQKPPKVLLWIIGGISVLSGAIAFLTDPDIETFMVALPSIVGGGYFIFTVLFFEKAHSAMLQRITKISDKKKLLKLIFEEGEREKNRLILVDKVKKNQEPFDETVWEKDGDETDTASENSQQQLDSESDSGWDEIDWEKLELERQMGGGRFFSSSDGNSDQE